MPLTKTLLALALGAAMVPAAAAQFDFYKLDQPNAIATTDFLPANGVKCTTHAPTTGAVQMWTTASSAAT